MPTEPTVPPGRPDEDRHDWLSLVDGDDTWMFDTTFLLSSYRCVYGDGCHSIVDEPDHDRPEITDALGCCVHGAHFVDDDDLSDVAAAAALLTDDDWQFRKKATRKGGPFKQNKEGDWVTRRTEGACIFLNRHDFPGGSGCALHRAALARDERPLDWKPDVCWQVPIRFDIHTDDNEHDTMFIRAWDRRDWGGGGDDFHWWCIEDGATYRGGDPVYRSCQDELIEMVGKDIFDRLASELDWRVAADHSSATPVSISNPPSRSANDDG